MADDTKLPTGPYIYPEYQSSVEDLMRNRMLAQYLFQQSAQSRPTEVITGRAVRRSPAEMLAQALTLYGSNNQMGEYNAQLRRIMTDNAAREGAEIRDVMGMADPRARIAAALASGNPRTQALGKSWQDIQTKMVEGAGKVAGDAGDAPSAMDIFRTQNIPGTYTPPVRKAPEFGMTPDQTPTVTNYDLRGVPTATLGRKPTTNTMTVHNKIDGIEGQAAMDILKGSLKEWKDRALEAKTTLGATQRAADALEKGATAGGGESWKQAIRKAAQAAGVTLPETDSVEQLQMALGQQLLAMIRKLAPVTDTDVEIVKQIEGSINTDPRALRIALDQLQRRSIGTLQQYKKYLESKRAAAQSPYLQGQLAGEEIGLEVPENIKPIPMEVGTVPGAPIPLADYMKRLQGGRP